MYKIDSPDWQEGWASDNYFIPGTEETTETGGLIRYHKYGGIKCSVLLASKMRHTLLAAWPGELPFDAIVPVPGSLPEDIAQQFKLPVFSVVKLNDIKAKVMPLDERKVFLNNFRSYYLKASKGILVIDDVFDTGNTLRGVCKSLKRYELPIYVLVLAINNHSSRNSGP